MSQIDYQPGSGPQQDYQAEEAGLSVGLMLSALWPARKLIAIIVGAMIVLAVLYSFSIKTQYTATAVIGPVENGNAPSGGGLSALSALTGGAFTAQQNSFDKYAQLLQSARLGDMLQNDPRAMHILFGSSWDPQTHQLKRGGGMLSSLRKMVTGGGAATHMSRAAVTEVIVDKIQFAMSVKNADSHVGGIGLSVLKNQLTRVSISVDTPDDAVYLLGMILRDADFLARSGRMENVGDRVVYLQNAIKATNDLTLRDSLESILTDQERTLMTLKADRYYSVDLIDPPAPDSSSGANLQKYLLVAVLFGLVFSLLAIFLALRAAVAHSSRRDGEYLEWLFARPLQAVRGKRA